MSIVDKYRLISQIGYICAIFFMIIAIILFFTLKINRVFGFITGISKKKAIKEINEHNEYTSDGLSGNISTDIRRKVGRTSEIGSVSITSKIPTSKIIQNQDNLQETTLLKVSNNTFDGENETTILKDNSNIVSGVTSNEFIVIKDIVYIHTDIVI